MAQTIVTRRAKIHATFSILTPDCPLSISTWISSGPCKRQVQTELTKVPQNLLLPGLPHLSWGRLHLSSCSAQKPWSHSWIPFLSQHMSNLSTNSACLCLLNMSRTYPVPPPPPLSHYSTPLSPPPALMTAMASNLSPCIYSHTPSRTPPTVCAQRCSQNALFPCLTLLIAFTTLYSTDFMYFVIVCPLY